MKKSRNLLEQIRQRALVFDGAMGTMIYQRDIFLNACYDELCLTQGPLICIAIYALRCCISQQAVFYGSHPSSFDLSGKPALLYGLTWLSGAFFLHFHYFWPTLRTLGILADLGKTISLLCLIGTLGYVLWSIIM